MHTLFGSLYIQERFSTVLGQVYLTNEDNLQGRGRVVVSHRGMNGTICSEGWDDNDATVVCRMNGYT